MKTSAKLRDASHIGREITFKEKGGSKRTVIGTVEEEVWVMTAPDYKAVIQRARFGKGVDWGPGTHFYRVGYWTLSKRGRKLIWGQYALSLSEGNFRNLLAQAREKGWQVF